MDNRTNEMQAYTCTQAFSSDEGPESGEDSEEDLVTEHLTFHPGVMGGRAGDGDGEEDGAGPGSPTTATITQALNGSCYHVLEDNIHQLQGIQELVQRMRITGTSQGFHLPLIKRSYARLSSSCPSLAEDADSDLDLTPVLGGQISPLAKSSISIGADSDGAGSQELLLWPVDGRNEGDSLRRRSWSALEVEALTNREKSGAERQRSVSLSSLGSNDEAFANGRPTHSQESSSHGIGNVGISSSSVNETGLQSPRTSLQARKGSEGSRLLTPRLTLQKSISTPSIIAVKDSGEGTSEGNTGGPLSPAFHDDEDHGTSKRRKRGSLFFRKKKDKDKPKRPHQFVSVCFSNSALCETCSRPLANKLALRCESCHITVHEGSCRDHVAECGRFRIPRAMTQVIFPRQIIGRPASVAGSASFGKASSGMVGGGFKKGASPVPSDAQGFTRSDSSQSKMVGDERDTGGYPDDHVVPSAEDISGILDFSDEGPAFIRDLDVDPFLKVQAEEPECWAHTVERKTVRKMKDREVKRQEHIYEFIITEKHHCLTLKLMQKVFAEGLQRYLQLDKDVERLFPRLPELIDIHLEFLRALRQRQAESPVVGTISDILLQQFSGEPAERLKAAYGEFCSRHKDAVALYKGFVKSDRRFEQFVLACAGNTLLRKKGIPECILFVTQRITKYPLLIDPLIKAARDNKEEQEKLVRALTSVKQIIVAVDDRVAEREREVRKLDIYNKMDAKSFTLFHTKKFKKSDILTPHRCLRFEGVANLVQPRVKSVLVVVLSDVLFFLHEANGKYHFMQVPPVLSLQRLLVREKAGQGTSGLYLISNPSAPDPTMYEIDVQTPKDRSVWIQAIRSAVRTWPQEEEEELCDSEELRRNSDARAAKVAQVTSLMRGKDMELALLLEEKMRLAIQLGEVGQEEGASSESILSPPRYSKIMTDYIDGPSLTREQFMTIVHEANQLISLLHGPGSNLSRSVSSVGEHQSDAYVSPLLPKRAETFGGFDNAPPIVSKGSKKKSKESKAGRSSPSISECDSVSSLPKTQPPKVIVDGADAASDGSSTPKDQGLALQLTHYLNYFLCLISQQMTTIESMQAQLAETSRRLSLAGREKEGRERRPAYNQALEELRNLQDRFSQEKAEWGREKETQEKELTEQRQELLRLQEQVRAEQEDIKEQRDTLYRKLATLQSHGVVLGSSLQVLSTGSPTPVPAASEDLSAAPLAMSPSSMSPPTSGTDQRRKIPSGAKREQAPVSMHLMSATNQQKTMQGATAVRQQLPMKLAQGASGGSSAGLASPTTAASSLPPPTAPRGMATTPSGPAWAVRPRDSVQQMLPLRLSESTDHKGRTTASTSRLSSGSFSPPSHSEVPPTHIRTGSSPALMQGPVPLQPTKATSPPAASKTQRTNTYPKLPERRSPSRNEEASASPTKTKDEHQIFFL